MDKRTLHHFWTKFRLIRPRYFLILCLVSGLVCVLALRHNYQTMVQLRNQVYAADKSNGDVQGALQNLRSYVYSHMNTSLSAGQNAVYPPIQLKYTYDRLVAAQSKQATASNSQIYTDAQHYCEAAIPDGFSGRYRISCIQNYISTHGSKQAPTIPDGLYKFDFVAAKWSPDLAGWSLVICLLSGLLFIVFILSDYLIKRAVR